MNRGVLQSSPVQQMMAGNPNWWSINNMRPPTLTNHHHHQQEVSSASPFISPPLPNNNNNNNNLFLYQYSTPISNTSSPTSSSSSSLPMPVAWSHDNPDQFPESWSQLLLGGFMGDEDKANMGQFQAKKLENWEEQLVLHQSASSANSIVDVKQETSPASSYIYGHAPHEDFSQQAVTKPTNWSQIMPPVVNSSPNSRVTSFNSNNNMLDFCTTTTTNTNNKKVDPRHPPPDRSSECNSNANGGALKKARVQPSSTQPTFKVRKEKLGDRITALHQLVSPFGKTDTASVLLEAIGYIRFLQNQIEALSLPYLGSGSSNMRQQQPVQDERNNLFPEDPGQGEEPKKDLRSRGLCLVPVSCTLQVGSDNGADYWAPAFGGGFR